MIEESPDIILLQEVPVWAGGLLREATGMGVTLAPAYGAHVPFLHVPLPLALGAADRKGAARRGAHADRGPGQRRALRREHAAGLGPTVQINDRHRLRGEPRIAQLVRLRHRSAGRELVVANVHADSGDNRHQLERAGYVLERFARGAPMVLGGDFNADADSAALRSLVARGWLDHSADVGIDHLLVRGMRVEQPAPRWAPERRDLALNGGPPVRLSDHDPVDAVVAF